MLWGKFLLKRSGSGNRLSNITSFEEINSLEISESSKNSDNKHED